MLYSPGRNQNGDELRYQSRRLDPPLIAGVVLLCSISLLVLYSAGSENTDLLIRQSVRIAVAFFAMFIIAYIPPTLLERWSPWVFTIGLVLLGIVLVIGYIGKGAQRWINLGVIQFQPAELMKLGLPMMVAWILTRHPLPPRLRDFLFSVVALVVPAVLVVMQPDLGTALLLAASGIIVIFLAGLSWRYLLGAGLALAAVAPLLWNLILHDYQRTRIITLFDPWSDPLGAGYHTIQSMIAIGSGGVAGKGWLNGSQSQLEFIPERSTDFIFAVFAEEFGLYGAILLILLYLFVVARALVIAFYARGTYSRLLAGSLALTFFFYVFVNIGMVVGILPVVGVPLPLISYGGTSMVTLMAGFGILMGINGERQLMT